VQAEEALRLGVIGEADAQGAIGFRHVCGFHQWQPRSISGLPGESTPGIRLAGQRRAGFYDVDNVAPAWIVEGEGELARRQGHVWSRTVKGGIEGVSGLGS